jgi:hydroxypyruvate isomerase
MATTQMRSLRRARFSANLAMMYTEHPFLERFRAAAAAGFTAVEISTPEMYKHSAQALRAQLDEFGLRCVLFNMPAGDWPAGERGIGALAGRDAEFDASIETTLAYAAALRCPQVHCLSGLVEPSDVSDRTYRESLRRALGALAPQGVDVLIEPINQRSIPDFYLRSYAQAAETIDAVSVLCGGSARPRLLFDLFHCQLIRGDVVNALREYIERTGHIQIAGAPDRNEPDEHNELNYPHLFRVLGDELRWDGYVGCEYMPRGGTNQGLGWLHRSGLEDEGFVNAHE